MQFETNIANDSCGPCCKGINLPLNYNILFGWLQHVFKQHEDHNDDDDVIDCDGNCHAHRIRHPQQQTAGHYHSMISRNSPAGCSICRKARPLFRLESLGIIKERKHNQHFSRDSEPPSTIIGDRERALSAAGGSISSVPFLIALLVVPSFAITCLHDSSQYRIKP